MLPSFVTLLSDAWRIYRTHFLRIMGFSGWLLFPLVLQILFRISFGESDLTQLAIFFVSAVSIGIAVWSFCHIVLLAAEVKATNAPPATLPDIHALALPVFFTFVIYALVVLVGILAVVPGILFAVWFAFAPTIAVIERRGVLAALGESRALVRGQFFRTLGRLFAMDALFLAAYFVLVIGIDLALGYDLAHLDVTAPLPVVLDAFLGVFEVVAAPLVIVYRTVLYLAMKTR